MHALVMSPETWRNCTVEAKLHLSERECAFAAFTRRVKPDGIAVRLHIVPGAWPQTGERDVRVWCASAVADMRDNLEAAVRHISNLEELVLVDPSDNASLAFLSVGAMADSLTALRRLEISTSATRTLPEYWPRGLELVTSLTTLKLPVRDRIPECLSLLDGLRELVLTPHSSGPVAGMEHLPRGLTCLVIPAAGASLRSVSRLTSLARLDIALVDHAHPDHPAAAAALDALPTSLVSLGLVNGPSEVPRSLARMRGLDSLMLARAELGSTDGFAALTALTSLRLIECNTAGVPGLDLSPLSGLTGLRNLCARGRHAGGLADLGVMRALTGLTTLDIDVCSNDADLAPLAALARLHVLGLVYTHAKPLPPGAPKRGIPRHIARLASLRSLHILDCTWASDFRAVAGMTTLTSLALAGSLRGSTIPSAVAGLTRLVKLDVSRSARPLDSGFHNLRALTSLQQLMMSGGMTPASAAKLQAGLPDGIVVHATTVAAPTRVV